MAILMDVAALEAFFATAFPQMNAGGQHYTITSVAENTATIRLDPDHRHLRPGDTVSGPTLFALADFAAYAVILAHIGPVALAVTTNMTINFLRKPALGPILGTAQILKLGKRLAVIDIAVTSGEALVAQATATYSIPPR
ncbi:hypothetical protein sos41_30530 [Alphaproteobacteria bacterium SO-S41]|nr:hypothetical protein sos41_30530 [Alphaproteobacteria bacterium SO-S41]